MAKKKKLVDNLQEIINSGDINAFKAVFDKCEITATNRGKSTSNAFSYQNLTPEHIQFLIDNGLNPNSDCGFGYSAVAHQAANRENLKCLLKNYADINYIAVSYRGCALAKACSTLNVDAVRNLLEEKASIDVICDIDGKNLLDGVLAHCDNIYIIKALDISKMLLNAGVRTTDRTKEYVQSIGKRFEFFRDNISNDIVDKLSDALEELYILFDVTPVQRRVMHNNSNRISVTSDRWQTQHEELWQMLVPGIGKAETVQGEMIRIVGKITYEVLDNGGINWDDDYKKMLQALVEFLKKNKALDEELVEEACGIVKNVTASSDKNCLYRLTEIVVKWVLANPNPILLGEVNYNR